MQPLLTWVTSPHFWVAVLAPGLLASYWGFSSRERLRQNYALIFSALLLTLISALPPIDALTRAWAKYPDDVHALPAFPFIYLLRRPVRELSSSFCFAMTFATLLTTDIIVTFWYALRGIMAADAYPGGIGGGGILDGLVVLPVLSALLVWVSSKRRVHRSP